MEKGNLKLTGKVENGINQKMKDCQNKKSQLQIYNPLV